MTPELRAAAERLRRHRDRACDAESPYRHKEAGYHNGAFDLFAITQDGAKLVDGYLADNPADDDLPISKEWLLSCGWIWFNPPTRLTGCSMIFGEHLFKWGPEAGFHIGVNGFNAVKTRGDVRRLCRALGVSLKETQDGK